jgi:hypothetical protein
MTTARKTAGPPDAKINAKSFRTYRWGDREYLSVTSIRKLVGEPFALVSWFIGKVIDRAMSPEFITKIESSQDPDEDIPRIRKWLRAATTEERDAAADKGLDIHGALELGLAPEDCNEVTRPYIRQVYDFLATTGFTIVAQEFQCWNLSAGYAGTADVLFEKPDGTFVLGDWKTGKGIYVDAVVQCHAYLAAEFVGTHGVVDEALTAKLAATVRGGILHVGSESWKWHEFGFDPEVVRAFLGSVAFAQLLAKYPDGPAPLFDVEARREGAAS